MKIRKYEESDAEEKAEVLRKSVKEIASEDYSKQEIEVWSDVEVEEDPLPEEKVRYVAIEDEKIVGFGEYNREENEVTGLYVHPDYTGNGIGEKLLEKVEKNAKEHGLDILTCLSTVTAKDFYQKHGYKIVEETTHQMEDQNLTVYKMEQEL
jgi:putative acetyltransferase